MRLFLLSVLSILFVNVIAQGTISGQTKVQPGENSSYTVSFPQWNNNANVTWSVTGGTFIPNGQLGCIVQWDNENKTGIISAYEDLYNQEAELYVQVGESVAAIYPLNQILSYNTTPTP